MAINNLENKRPEQDYSHYVQKFTYSGNNGPIFIRTEIPNDELLKRDLDTYYQRIQPDFPPNRSVNERMDNNALYKYPEETKEENTTFVCPTEGIPDRIFGSFPQGDDRERYPDHKQYIFYTSNHGRCQVMYPNNLIMPVRANPDLTSEFFNKFKSKSCGVSSNGAYIIDYYSIRNIPHDKAGIWEYLNYYHTSGVVMNDNRAVLNDIIKAVNEENRKAYVRVVTFIPQGIFTTSPAVFVRHAGVVVGLGLMGRYLHPYSEEASYLAGKVAKTSTNYIEIDVVDNTTTNDYFVSVGNDIIKIEPERNLEKPNGASLNIYRNNNCIVNKKCELKDLEDTIGIYRSKEEALYNGDVLKAKEQIIENRKLDTRILESELSYRKVVHSKDLENSKFGNDMLRMAAEKENIELDMDKEKLKHQIEEFKQINVAIRTAMETKQLLLKSSIDALKQDHEVRKLEFEYGISLAQFITKIINLGISVL